MWRKEKMKYLISLFMSSTFRRVPKIIYYAITLICFILVLFLFIYYTIFCHAWRILLKIALFYRYHNITSSSVHIRIRSYIGSHVRKLIMKKFIYFMTHPRMSFSVYMCVKCERELYFILGLIK